MGSACDLPKLTRFVLADGPGCELAQFEGVLDQICAALGGIPPSLRRELGRALLAMAVAYIGGRGPAAFSPGDTGA